ncbi:anion exchange protein 2 isoform X2 [Ischnura elegans]|uniref:anion exchange protein 2 isoform X2 n=1 Tax=Ischnura elegans TaxID=197161 RepID=UPI001ED88DCB|nr:anion exchange protein 2 isoform X2 [Ischnura elegans]
MREGAETEAAVEAGVVTVAVVSRGPAGALPRTATLTPRSRRSSSGHEPRRRSLLTRARGKVIRWLRRSFVATQQDSHGVEAGSDLDEEMEKVFSMGDPEKFDLARISGSAPTPMPAPNFSAASASGARDDLPSEAESSPPTAPLGSTPESRQFGEEDYKLHRKKSYPHMHMPLKSLHSRSMRHRLTSPRLSDAGSSMDSGGASTSGTPKPESSTKPLFSSFSQPSFASTSATMRKTSLADSAIGEQVEETELDNKTLSEGKNDMEEEPASTSAAVTSPSPPFSSPPLSSPQLSLSPPSSRVVSGVSQAEDPTQRVPDIMSAEVPDIKEKPESLAQSPQLSSAGESIPTICLSPSPPPPKGDWTESARRHRGAPAVYGRSLSESPVFGTSPPDFARRVQFVIGETPAEGAEGDSAENSSSIVSPAERVRGGSEKVAGSLPSEGEVRKPRKKHSRHHHHGHYNRFRKYSLQEDPQWRMHRGSTASGVSLGGLPVEPARVGPPLPPELKDTEDEATTLQQLDLDDLASHRFDDARGLRRHKIQSKSSTASFIHIGRKDGIQPIQSIPLASASKKYDHSPHEVFVQLDELLGVGEEREWKETARWIKYEENVEEGSDRWGRPHVASLSFHSLLNLRRCLETGIILLDLEEKDLPGVAYRVVEQMVVEEQIHSDDKATVMRALLLRHRHVNEHEKFHFGMRRTFSSYASLQNLADDKGKPRIVPSISSFEGLINSKSSNNQTAVKQGENNHTAVDMKEELTYTSSAEDLKKKEKERILRRIPIGAEATTVLVGSVEFLEQPTIAFVRLAQGILLPTITEVPIPVRFMFILLGPKESDLDYHEIGRSISTLMSNAHFHNIAYKANEKKELLSAINEFLDDSIVLPPGNWERKALLPFDELKAKSEAIRRRKTSKVLQKDETQQALLPGDEKRPPRIDPLKRTRRPFGGLINDIKRRFPHYISDFIDGLNFPCFAAAIFIYFAALSGAITFGGLLGDKTENWIGISETLVATSLAGVLFSFLSGQPLVIIGATGPLLLYDESLYSFCSMNQVDFLAMRVWIGVWLTVIALIVVAVEGSVLVKMFTRFTQDIFATLISLLFIYESLLKLYQVFCKHPLVATYCDLSGVLVSNGTNNSTNITNPWENVGLLSNNSDVMLVEGLNSSLNEVNGSKVDVEEGGFVHLENQPNTALLCTILALGTFFIAYYLRQFRNSKFLGRNARRALGDFGVPIAIITMVTLDYLIPDTYTEKLMVPEGLSPSRPGSRGWIVSPTIEIWVAFAAVVPALLIYILLFMETHICELIIDNKDRKLRKGSGFHLDIVLVCLINTGCGILGAPWMCAATVRSVAHVSAVTVMSRTHAPGDKPHIIEVKEQRLSALVVSVLVGVSVLMAPLLRLVPIAVLFGVFLYMGISSTNGIQFIDRLHLFFMPVKHHPRVPYVRRVQTMKMHLFTFIQLMCLVVLWTVKSTQAALAFPFFLILMVPLRIHLKHCFSPSELHALDSSDAALETEDDEPDFYTQARLPG